MKWISFYLIAIACIVFPAETGAKVTIPSILGSNMVLQRNDKANIWGKASPGAKVNVTTSWDARTYSAKADKEGNWLIKVTTGDAGGPYTITISDGESITLDNVLLGEVWVCGGQSNMEMRVQGFMHQPVNGALETILEAPRHSQMRFFTVERAISDTLMDNCGGSWLESSPESVANFSACAYFFGKELNDMLDVPIGLITTNWAGTAIEPWIDKPTFESIEDIDKAIALKRAEAYPEQAPASLYNAMVNPITNYTAKGFIWYQGESNRGYADDYVKLLTALIKSWREKWSDVDMPFYMVQLAPYPYGNKNGFTLPLMIEAQYKVASGLPKVAIAATTDIGSPVCIHPPHKKEVGQRLAMLALQNDYGVEGLPLPAPTFKSMSIDGNKVTLDFNNLASHPNRWNANSFQIFADTEYIRPAGFEIAGDDQIFYPARGTFKDAQSTIEIFSDSVPNPVAVRYYFHNYVPDANVRTCLGQPLVPFRTDNWAVKE